MSRFNHIQQWSRPPHYAGAEWWDYFSSGVGQSRDSSALERANFQAMLIRLGRETDTVRVVREHHWAVGWVEWIAIHKDDGPVLALADKALEDLEGYPILDEALFSEIEMEDCSETWINCYDRSDRVQYLKEHGTGPSVFSDIRQALQGSWHHAANILNCPSDLIY